MRKDLKSDVREHVFVCVSVRARGGAVIHVYNPPNLLPSPRLSLRWRRLLMSRRVAAFDLMRGPQVASRRCGPCLCVRA